MKLKSSLDLERFFTAVRHCQGRVTFETEEGDSLNPRCACLCLQRPAGTILPIFREKWFVRFRKMKRFWHRLRRQTGKRKDKAQAKNRGRGGKPTESRLRVLRKRGK